VVAKVSAEEAPGGAEPELVAAAIEEPAAEPITP
jgi:hypothetical protein